MPRETETGSDTRHDGRHEVIEISVGRGIEFEGADADIVQRLIVNAESLIRVFDELLFTRQNRVIKGGTWTERVALYGSTTVSETFGDGTTENVAIIRSGYSSRILLIKRVPIPAPVPPPRECVIWNPWRQSHPSASRRTTSRT